MAVDSRTAGDSKRFLVRCRELNTAKLFVEFYLPEHRELIDRMRRGPHPVKSLREICVRMFDGPFGSDRKIDMYRESGIPYVRVKDVLPEGIDTQGLAYILPEKHKELGRSRTLPGNLLITIAGRLGTAAVFPESLGEGNITGHVVGIELPEDVNPHYVASFVNSPLGQFQVTRLGQRTTRPELNLVEVGQILIPLPPRRVQDRVARTMQEAYSDRRRKLAEARRLYLGSGTYLLESLGIDLADLQGHRSALASIRDMSGGRFDFESVVTVRSLEIDFADSSRLGDVCTPVNIRTTPAEDSPARDINYVGLGNISRDTGALVGFAPTKGLQILSSSPTFKKGDIVFGRMRPYLNKVWLAEFDGVCSGEALVFRPDTAKVDVRFLHALLLSRVTLDQIIPLQSGASLPRVSVSDVLDVKLPIPTDLDRQIEIGEEVQRRREAACRLRAEAASVVARAKVHAERLTIGEEAAG